MKNIPLEQMGREGGLISTHFLTHVELMSEYFHVYKGIRGRKKNLRNRFLKPTEAVDLESSHDLTVYFRLLLGDIEI